jgi:hypothetical protein
MGADVTRASHSHNTGLDDANSGSREVDLAGAGPAADAAAVSGAAAEPNSTAEAGAEVEPLGTPAGPFPAAAATARPALRLVVWPHLDAALAAQEAGGPGRRAAAAPGSSWHAATGVAPGAFAHHLRQTCADRAEGATGDGPNGGAEGSSAAAQLQAGWLARGATWGRGGAPSGLLAWLQGLASTHPATARSAAPLYCAPTFAVWLRTGWARRGRDGGSRPGCDPSAFVTAAQLRREAAATAEAVAEARRRAEAWAPAPVASWPPLSLSLVRR